MLKAFWKLVAECVKHFGALRLVREPLTAFATKRFKAFGTCSTSMGGADSNLQAQKIGKSLGNGGEIDYYETVLADGNDLRASESDVGFVI
jgi:hypothetical protein